MCGVLSSRSMMGTVTAAPHAVVRGPKTEKPPPLFLSRSRSLTPPSFSISFFRSNRRRDAPSTSAVEKQVAESAGSFLSPGTSGMTPFLDALLSSTTLYGALFVLLPVAVGSLALASARQLRSRHWPKYWARVDALSPNWATTASTGLKADLIFHSTSILLGLASLLVFLAFPGEAGVLGGVDGGRGAATAATALTRTRVTTTTTVTTGMVRRALTFLGSIFALHMASLLARMTLPSSSAVALLQGFVLLLTLTVASTQLHASFPLAGQMLILALPLMLWRCLAAVAVVAALFKDQRHRSGGGYNRARS